MSIIPRILYVPLIPPDPRGDGGQQRSYHLEEALCLIGKVDRLELREVPERAVWLHKGVSVFRAAHRPSGAFARLVPPAWIRKNSMLRSFVRACNYRDNEYYQRIVKVTGPDRFQVECYDLLVCRYAKALSIASSLGIARERTFLDLDDHDLELLRLRLATSGCKGFPALGLRRKLLRLETFYQEVLASAGHIWASNPANLNETTGGHASLLKNIPPGEPKILPPSVEPVVLCVSTWSNAGNRHGLMEFSKLVWPRVLKQVPDARCLVAGSGYDEKARADLCSQGIELKGYVENLEALYQQALFTVAPVAFGGGTSIKVLESLSMARACVMTKAASRGYDGLLRDGSEIVVADTPEDFATACIRFFQTPKEATRMGLSGHEAVKHNFSRKAFQEAVQLPIHEFLDSR